MTLRRTLHAACSDFDDSLVCNSGIDSVDRVKLARSL
jgi:hypothetical protein